MSTRKRRDPRKEQFWRRVVQQWRQSGLPIRQFCRLHHVSEPSFHAWRRTLKERDAEPSATPFVPVRVVPEPSTVAAAQTHSHDPGIELILTNGRRLHIGPAFDASTLRRLLSILDQEGRPCS